MVRFLRVVRIEFVQNHQFNHFPFLTESMLAFSGIEKGRKSNNYWYKACRVITETKGNGGFEIDLARTLTRVTDIGDEI